MLPKLDVLELLRKIQESTTEDIDEEIGSFQKGDRVIYNIHGNNLNDSDLSKMMSPNELARRSSHNEKEATIIEMVEGKVSRYDIGFDDGYVIKDVTASELKKNEVESKVDEQDGLSVVLYRVYYENSAGEEKNADVLADSRESARYKIEHDSELDVQKIVQVKVIHESKTNEAEEVPQTMQPQEKPNINAEDYNMEDYSDEDLNKPDAKVKSKSEDSGNAIRGVEDEELKQEPDKVVTPKKESKLKEVTFNQEKEVLDFISTADDEDIEELYSKYISKEDFPGRLAARKNLRDEVKMQDDVCMEIYHMYISGKKESKLKVKKESRFQFSRVTKPLWLCNSCCKTFRSDESKCTECKSEDTEKIVQEQDVALFKEVYEVNYTDKVGNAKSDRVEAYDEADAKRMVSKSKGIELESIGKVAKVSKTNEDKIKESVLELIGEIPGIDFEDQQTLRWAYNRNLIPREWPEDEEVVDALSKVDADIPPEEKDQYDDLKPLYLRYVLLPKAKQEFASASVKKDKVEPNLQEQEKETYQVVAQGIVDKGDADKVATDKKGTVIADKDDPKKFAVIVKESTIKEDATSIKELETSIIGAMDKIGFDHFVGRRETEDGRVLEFRHPSGIDMEVLIKGHWYQRMKKEQEKGTADYS